MWIILRYLLVGIGSIGLWSWVRMQRQRPSAHDPQELIIYPNTPVAILRHEDDALLINWQHPSQRTLLYYQDKPFEGTTPPSHISPDMITGNINEVVIQPVDIHTRYYTRFIFDDQTTYDVPERTVPTPNIKNLRDIGGYQTNDGFITRWNTIFRGASLKDATEADHDALKRLGIQLICDLRTQDEVRDAPNRLPEDVVYQHIASETHENRFVQLIRLLLEPDYFDKVLLDLYTRVIIDQNSQLFGVIFKHIAEDNLPLLVHCAAGKDRTGIAIALLLRLLGVPDTIIQADYSLSNIYVDYFREISASLVEQLFRIGIDADQLTPVFSANPITIQRMLDYVDARYGSVEAYLLQMTALTEADFIQIRAKLLTEPN